MLTYFIFYNWFGLEYSIYREIFIFEQLTFFAAGVGALIPELNPKSIFDKLESNGFTHTIPMMLIVMTAFFIVVSPQVSIAVGFGFMFHLIIDTLFSQLGVKWFYPIWNRNLGFKVEKIAKDNITVEKS
jgi:membrane-bound metal-dependent hydrolase YbcI (DUF457 family)